MLLNGVSGSGRPDEPEPNWLPGNFGVRGRDPFRVRRLELEEVPEIGEGVPDSDEGTAELKE